MLYDFHSIQKRTLTKNIVERLNFALVGTIARAAT